MTVTDPALLIRISQLYRYGMPALDLYEATRGVWRLGPRRERAKYAFAVCEAIVREVYAIDSWHPAGTTSYKTRPAKDIKRRGRWEFVGRVAPAPVRARYIDRSVEAYFPRGAQNPFRYVLP